MLSSQVARSLKSYRHFSDIGVDITLSYRMLNFLGEANTSIHGLGHGDTARLSLDLGPIAYGD